jgi:hypothetical protein
MVCPQTQSRHKLCSSAVGECLINGGEDVRGYCFAAEITEIRELCRAWKRIRTIAVKDDQSTRPGIASIVALLGLLGMVLGEQLGVWIHTRKLDVSHAAAVCLVGESYNSMVLTQNRLEVSEQIK